MKMTFKKFYVGMLSGAVAVSTFAPMVNVRADGYTYTFKFSSNRYSHNGNGRDTFKD